MPDDLTRKRPEDPNYINRNQQWELNYWSNKLGVSIDTLRQAINKVGPSVNNIQRYLRH